MNEINPTRTRRTLSLHTHPKLLTVKLSFGVFPPVPAASSEQLVLANVLGTSSLRTGTWWLDDRTGVER